MMGTLQEACDDQRLALGVAAPSIPHEKSRRYSTPGFFYGMMVGMEAIKFMAIPYTLVRSNRRTLALVIERTGELTARAPRRMPLREIEAFIACKESWIARKQAMMRGRTARITPLSDGSLLPLAGEPLRLRLGEVPFAFEYHGALLLPAHVQVQKSLIPWLKGRAAESIGARVSQWEAATGLRAVSLGFSTAQTRWGSMNAKGALRLNVSLLFCPAGVVDYVIVHELAHMKHLNHSPAFWKLVGQILPEYQGRRDWLKENRHLIRLIGDCESM